jgi:hypothetical protein
VLSGKGEQDKRSKRKSDEEAKIDVVYTEEIIKFNLPVTGEKIPTYNHLYQEEQVDLIELDCDETYSNVETQSLLKNKKSNDNLFIINP